MHLGFVFPKLFFCIWDKDERVSVWVKRSKVSGPAGDTTEFSALH